MDRIVTVVVLVASVATCGGAVAETAAEKQLFKECNAVYAKLCKGIAPGPAMVGKCNRARPSIAEKIPEKCTEDFHNAVEGYEDTQAKH